MSSQEPSHPILAEGARLSPLTQSGAPMVRASIPRRSSIARTSASLVTHRRRPGNEAGEIVDLPKMSLSTIRVRLLRRHRFPPEWLPGVLRALSGCRLPTDERCGADRGRHQPAIGMRNTFEVVRSGIRG